MFSEYIDVCPESTNPVYTFDSGVNKMIRQDEQMRYDRIIVSCPQMQPTFIQMVGTSEIEDRVWPSDHFGLDLTMSIVSLS